MSSVAPWARSDVASTNPGSVASNLARVASSPFTTASTPRSNPSGSSCELVKVVHQTGPRGEAVRDRHNVVGHVEVAPIGEALKREPLELVGQVIGRWSDRGLTSHAQPRRYHRYPTVHDRGEGIVFA
jgi:hypothetical protein